MEGLSSRLGKIKTWTLPCSTCPSLKAERLFSYCHGFEIYHRCYECAQRGYYVCRYSKKPAHICKRDNVDTLVAFGVTVRQQCVCNRIANLLFNRLADSMCCLT